MIYIENMSTFCGISLQNGCIRGEQVCVLGYEWPYADQMVAKWINKVSCTICIDITSTFVILPSKQSYSQQESNSYEFQGISRIGVIQGRIYE